MNHPFLCVRYTFGADNDRDAATLARKIVVEQSVETPESLITADIEDRYVGRVVRIIPPSSPSDTYAADIEYAAKTVTDNFNQLINLIWGNVSMYAGVRLEQIQLSDECANQWTGPRFGIEGIRNLLGVHQRPLLSTALKPRGLSNDDFARLAYEFALAGGDIIKDDQNLMGDFEDFRERTAKCSAAVARANLETGYHCLYFPYVAAPFEQMECYLDWMHQIGIRGVLMCPLILGLDTTRALAQRYNLILMAHPAFSGGFSMQGLNGMRPALLYGTLYRLTGVDISVFVNPDTRFATRLEDSLEIAELARNRLGHLKPMFPCPAGGLQFDQIPAICKDYGVDSILLIGGSLLTHSLDMRTSTERFLQKITGEFPAWIRSDSVQTRSSACEFDVKQVRDRIKTLLTHHQFRWNARSVSEYKSEKTQTFQGVRRIELIGKAGELTSFDLRYFEVEPGGYTSLERHQHTHIIIGIRGSGLMKIEHSEHPIQYLDIAYVKPNAAHQLINPGNEPFGFFCLVDRKRDRPISLDQ